MRCLALLLALASPTFAQKKETPPPVTGQPQPAFAAIDTLLTTFITDNRVPGASIAIVKDGRLVHARGFGYADRDKKTPVLPTSLFRLASVTKPITVGAICLLVEQKKLTLDDRILEILKLKTPNSMDERWRAITVLHLIEHKAGFVHDDRGDPMFNSLEIARELKVPPPARQEHIIQFMLKRPLGYAPGSDQVYSNFGYCLLGRVIEKASGKSYEKFVTEELLKPLGIKSMQLGRTMTTARGEVRYSEDDPPTAPSVFANYLGKKVPTPYGAWCLEAMDSHGGWIASAVDLARFGSAVGQPERFPVVGGKTFAARFNPEYYHYGAFSGSATLFHRHSNGLTYVVLFNGRLTSAGKELAPEIHVLLKEFFKTFKDWPSDDQFDKYLKKP